MRQAKQKYEEKLAEECRSDPKYFWKYVQSQTKTNTGISPLMKENGEMAVSDMEKAETLNSFFLWRVQ